MAILTVRTEKVRFKITPLSIGQMRKIAQVSADSVRSRIRSGLNAKDQPSLALTEAYLRRKTARGLTDYRDWFWMDKTLRNIKVLRAGRWKATVGFDASLDRGLTNMIAAVQNRREEAFDVSKNDWLVTLLEVERQLQKSQLVKLVSLVNF